MLGAPRDGLAQLPIRPRSRAGETERARRVLVVEAVELVGNTRTSAAVAMSAAGLTVGDPADLASIQAAADRLRRSRLFRTVRVRTRPGGQPGRVRVVFEVKENRPHLRFGLGYEDFSGWYLIPIQLNLDNVTGHGEAADLSLHLGYRLAGLAFAFKRPLWPSADFWEIRLRSDRLDRIYFGDRTEFTQRVVRSGVDLRLGRDLARSLAVETWLSLETADVDSNAVVYRDRRTLDRAQGDEIPFALLPAAIQAGVGDRPLTRVGVALTAGGRQGEGLRARGLWGRLAGEGVLSRDGNYARLDGDLRAYQPLRRGGLVAGRVRVGTATADTPFYERYYLGGLYTVRGYPSHALSPPHGHSSFATASVELRTAWIGPPERPRLTAIAFADAGIGWEGTDVDLNDAGAGAGFGWRVRVPWLGYLGLDIGAPLSASPVDEAFHVNLSLGWTY